MKQRRPIPNWELLAIDQRAVHREADAIFFLFSPYAPENEYADGVACVHIRGPLDHHAGFGDNYDAIRQRSQEAFEDEDTHTVVFKIDSPGGAVSGLLDTVRAIRMMSEASAKPSVAYVDERAFSAAYAIASACDRIVLPRSGLLGSIGVISTMAEQVERDKMQGYRYVTLASGARKTDGHIHVPITEDAEDAERERVDELAGQFFELVREHRGISVKRVRGFQAGLFLGQKAVDVGLADSVSTFDELLAQLKKGLAQSGTSVPTSGEQSTESKTMGYRNALVAQIKETRQALAKATAKEKAELEGKLSGLQAALDAYEKTTEKHIEHHKTKESGDEEDEDEDGNESDRGDDEEGDEEKGDEEDDEEASGATPAKSAKSRTPAKAKAGKSKARYEDDEEEEEEEEARAEDDEEEARLVDLVRQATGKRGSAARGALAAILTDHQQLRAEVTSLTRARQNDKRKATLDAALKDRRITPAERKSLAKEDMPYVKAYLDARPRGLLFGQDDHVDPAAIPSALQGQLPADLKKQLDMAVAASGGTITAEQFLKDYEAEQAKRNASRNGAV